MLRLDEVFAAIEKGLVSKIWKVNELMPNKVKVLVTFFCEYEY